MPDSKGSFQFRFRLFLRNLDRHAWLEARTAYAIEIHDVLCTYSWIVLGDAVERVAALYYISGVVA